MVEYNATIMKKVIWGSLGVLLLVLAVSGGEEDTQAPAHTDTLSAGSLTLPEAESAPTVDIVPKTIPEPVAASVVDLVSTPEPAPAPARTYAAPTYGCNCSKMCTQMSSCSEAYFQLNTCGCSRRDGDNDGVPCESLCR